MIMPCYVRDVYTDTLTADRNCNAVILYYDVSQKWPNFETVYLDIIWIDFDDFWQKYSEDCRI